MEIKVIKFGGTSVGNAERMIQVVEILSKVEGKKLIVLSAMAGTTNALVDLAETAAADPSRALEKVNSLRHHYGQVVQNLFENEEMINSGQQVLTEHSENLEKLVSVYTQKNTTREILAVGELLSTRLFALKCKELGIKVRVIPALEFMVIDAKGEPALGTIKRKVLPFLETRSDEEWLITQGYVCRNHNGEVDNLKRGGSDYTATILGAVLEASEIQIWTDIDGVHNNDPRIVKSTIPIRYLSYREAAELAYFGAKILHPACVLPAEKSGVPLRLKYTLEPDKPGTLIGKDTSKRAITAIAAKDGIYAIKIYSHRMLMAYGFLRRVFQVFENHRTSIDMITTSEVAVSVTIDEAGALEDIIQELSTFAEVEAVGGYSIICIVGNALYDDPAYVHDIFSRLEGIPLRMVSMGGSRYNLSVLVKSIYKEKALVQLNEVFLDARRNC